MRSLKFLALFILLLVLALLGQLVSPAAASPLMGITSTPTPTPTATPGPPQSPGPVVVDPLITKEVNVQLAQVGDTVQFTLRVFNPNAIDVLSVVVVDPLPVEVDFISLTQSQGAFMFDAPSNALTFDIGTLTPGQTVTVVIQTRINERGQPQQEIRNTAVLWVSGLNRGTSTTVVVQIIPGVIPITGLPPAPPLWPTLALAALAALTAPGLWRLWRRWSQRRS